MQLVRIGRHAKLRGLVHGVLPPILLRGARSVRQRLARPVGRGELRAAAYYDAVYEGSSSYKEPYWESRYYFLWSVVADRLVRANVGHVLDIGCGPGQFASLLRDKGFDRYCGIDFSETSVELAKGMCPTFEFVVADLSDPETLGTREYDCVLALEVLEHVEDDVGILAHIRLGTTVFITVPNFPDPAHVRYFRDAQAVRARYEHLFSNVRVDTFRADGSRMRYFLMEGIRAAVEDQCRIRADHDPRELLDFPQLDEGGVYPF